jgi:hypothetical protein
VTWQRVLVLYVILAVLAVEYFVVERRPAHEPEAEPARTRFVPVEPAALRELRLRRDGRTVVTRRDAGGWAVLEPAGAVVPPDLIAAFANALASAEEIARYPENAPDAPAYGFADAGQVEMVAEGREPIVVTLGATNPTGTAVYARRAGSRDVVLIGRNVRYYEDLIFQAVSASRVPETEQGAPVGG